MAVQWFAIVFGLEFVLSFGCWCTDFLVVQRALAAEDLAASQRTPLIAAFPKLMYGVLAIFPGLIILSILPNLGEENYKDRKSTRLNSVTPISRMPSSA